MLPEQPIDAVRNRKTLRLFIVVDDTLDRRYKVVNPSGEVLILPDLLFEEDPITVTPDQFATEFTPEQLAAFAEHSEKAAVQAALAKAAAARAPEPRRVVAEPAKRPKTKRQATPVQSRRGLGASWTAPRLTFYKHKIEPLHPKQSFKITVEGNGEFELTKEEFVAQFNDVMMSPSYRSDGLYTYPQIPEKMQRYRKS